MSIQNINSLIHEIYFIKWGTHHPHWWTRERRCSSQIQENGLKLDITEGGRKHYDIQRWQHLRGGRQGGGAVAQTKTQTERQTETVTSPAAVSPSGLALSSFMSTMQCPSCCVPSSICPTCLLLLPLAPAPPFPPPPRKATVQSSSPAHSQTAERGNKK